MKTINFKQAIRVLGYEPVKTIKGYNFRSVFAEKGNSLYYFHIEDLRDESPMIYYRTAENLSDFHGGTNMFDMEDILAEKGYKVFEPRQKCDYNSY